MSSGLISTTIPNLVNGVSQQPYNLRLASQAEEQINGYSSVVEGLKKRPPSRFISKISNTPFGKAMIHTINRDLQERYIVVITNGNLRVFRLDGSEVTVNFPNGKGYLSAADPSTSFSAVTVADYTFILNRTVEVKALPATIPTSTPMGMAWIRQGGYGITYSITFEGITKSHKTPDGSNSNHTEQIATDFIAQKLREAFLADSAFTAIGNVSRTGSTLIFSRKDGADFSLSISDGIGDTGTKLIKGSIQRFSDLPARAASGIKIEVKGDQSSSFDNYYVRYDTSSTGSAAGGVWVETAKEGEQYKLNPATMPHALVREADGTFTFKVLPWEDRKVGDLESCPMPSFVGKKMNDIFFHRNRLGFAADENVIFSRAGDFFNFFRASATQVVDTDPIDVAVSHTKVSIIRHAIPFNETLLLFSDQTQFQLGATDLLTPTTISINQTTEFQASLLAKPVGAGRNVYFAVNRGIYSGVREYYVDGDTKTNDAADVTSHVPHYVPGGITKLAASSNENVLVALSPEKPNEVYIYKYFWEELEKLQSSWSRWVFSPNTKILYVEFIESDLWMLVERNGEVTLESISLEAGRSDGDIGFEYHLDQRCWDTECTVSYDPGTNTTTIQTPYTVTAGEADEFQIIAWEGSPNRKSGEFIQFEFENGKFKVNGNLPKFIIGRKYEFRYLFSTFVIKEEAVGGGQMTVGEGRIQLRRVALNFSKTGYFKVVVTPFRRDPYEYVFSGRVVGSGNNIIGRASLEEGRFKFPVGARNDAVKIELVSDKPLPCAFMSAEWEALYVIRSRRL
jgi:hypothetical protein